MLVNVGAGGGAAAAAPTAGAGGAAAEAPAEEAKKEEEEGKHNAVLLSASSALTRLLCRKGRIGRGHGLGSLRLGEITNVNMLVHTVCA